MVENKFSLVIPIYKNLKNLPRLLVNLEKFENKYQYNLELIFVIDGNIENEFEYLKKELKNKNFSSQLILHSRNFGSFGAIRTGLIQATGDYIAVTTADGQDPLNLINTFFKFLIDKKYEVVVGQRIERHDPNQFVIWSKLFWFLYKKIINKEIPNGGVDIFACSKLFRNELVSLSEANSSLIGQLFWLGFSRKIVPYVRKKRTIGRSAWTLTKKINYMSDSIFSFTDLPLKFFLLIGFLGLITSIIMSLIVIIAKFIGQITIPGYSSLIIYILFFSSINIFSGSIVGLYTYRCYENTKNRPLTIISKKLKFKSKKI